VLPVAVVARSDEAAAGRSPDPASATDPAAAGSAFPESVAANAIAGRAIRGDG
jgi:hypothetical protein